MDKYIRVKQTKRQPDLPCQYNHGGLCRETERPSGYMDRCPAVLGEDCLFREEREESK
jgi:hypothetical protein